MTWVCQEIFQEEGTSALLPFW